MSAGETNASEPLMTCRNPMKTPKPGGMDAPGQGQTQPADGLSGVRHEGGVTPAQALMRNVGTCRSDAKGEVQVATTTRRAYQCGAQGRTNPYERGRPVMRLEQRGWAERLSSTSNWQQEETLAATKP